MIYLEFRNSKTIWSIILEKLNKMPLIKKMHAELTFVMHNLFPLHVWANTAQITKNGWFLNKGQKVHLKAKFDMPYEAKKCSPPKVIVLTLSSMGGVFLAHTMFKQDHLKILTNNLKKLYQLNLWVNHQAIFM